MAYAKHFSTRRTPQSEAIPGSNQVKNTAGGYAYGLDDWARLRRFLILGAEGGTYYIKERTLTIENATAARRCIAADGMRVIQVVTEVSDGGRAPKNEPALFVLAMATAASDANVRRAAWQALPRVARIGTHLFQFVEYREAFGGWGRLARTGLANWYLDKTPVDVAYQALKYQQRNGWSHRDLLRICHAFSERQELNDVFSAITHKEASEKAPGVEALIKEGRLPSVFEGVYKAQIATKAADVAHIVTDYNLTREMVPTQWLSDPVVYEALFQRMPMTAMVRNLGNMSKIGLLKPMSDTSKAVVSRLRDRDVIRKARLHPLGLLVALKTYSQGRGRLGSGEWTVVPQVVDALNEAIALSFDLVEPTGKRHVIGVDVSGSMSYNSPLDGISCAEAAAMLALVAAKTESEYFIGGFASSFRNLEITAADTFATATRKAQDQNFGRTDCAVPMLHAMKEGIQADVFQVITDNETWCGSIHPSQALQAYRQRTGINSKMVVLGMASNGFSIADPNDPGMLDVVGLDTSVPSVVAEFCR